MNAIFAVALKEYNDSLRNRWLISITAIFAILSVGLTYYGSAASGQLGVVSIGSSIASLSSLAVFIIPLISMMLAYDSFVGELESGTLLLLLTYPLSRLQLLLGKFIGQGAVIVTATLLGFGVSALIMVYETEAPLLIFKTFGLFILSASLLGLSFMSMAYVISLLVNEKSKAAGMAIMLWFAFVLVFDLALLAVLVGVTQGLEQQSITLIMLFNPADLFRIINLSLLDAEGVSGVLSIALSSSWPVYQLLLIMLAWIFAPLLLAYYLFARKAV